MVVIGDRHDKQREMRTSMELRREQDQKRMMKSGHLGLGVYAG